MGFVLKGVEEVEISGFRKVESEPCTEKSLVVETDREPKTVGGLFVVLQDFKGKLWDRESNP